ncbi:MAG: class I SAM-dependent methyltransferase [bacterium]
MAKIEPFEKHTGRYDEWFTKNRFVFASELNAIRGLLPKATRGIEIGVGTGRFGAPLGITIGIEPSRKMGAVARQRGIRVIEATAENLPLKDACFDVALMVTTICFLDDIEAAFKGVHDILRNKGAFVIGFVDRESPLGKMYQQRKAQSVFYQTATFYSVDEVVFYLKQAGFKGFDFRQTIFGLLPAINTIENSKEGFGEGSFVVIKAIK